MTVVYVLRCVGLANGERTDDPTSGAGMYLHSADWTARIVPQFTWQARNAMPFYSFISAMQYIQTIHPTERTRSWDGEPNKPLTAWTWLVESVDEHDFADDERSGVFNGQHRARWRMR